MPPNERSTEPTFAGTWGIAALLWLPGLVMIAAALGWIPSTAAGFHAPHWVVFAAGMTFFGRIVFGFGAVILDGIAAAMLLSWLKRR